MAECDRVASRVPGRPVHFAADPTMTRITQIWTGAKRWQTLARSLEKIATTLRFKSGLVKRDHQIRSREHANVPSGFDTIQ